MDSTAPLALEVFYDSITVCDLFQRTWHSTLLE